MSPERLWILSAALRRRGHRKLALLIKKLNSVIYHNSLAPGAEVSPDVTFVHHGFGTVVHSNVTIGKRVTIYQNVTIAVRSSTGSPHRIFIGDDVNIGANSVIISPLEGTLHVGDGARIGAGAVVAGDVPAGATVVSAPVRILTGDRASDGNDQEMSPPAPAPMADETP